MKCKIVLKLLDDYIAGRLSNSMRLSVARHLDSCYDCSFTYLLVERRVLRICLSEDGKTIRFEYKRIMERK